MYAEIDTLTGLIALTAPTTAGPVVHQIPGVRHNSQRQLWLLPLSWATCVTMRGVIPDLQVGPALAAWAQRERATRIDPSLALRTEQDVPPTEELGQVIDLVEGRVGSEAARDAAAPPHLRPYQRAGSAFLATAGSALLGDVMRLGKTPQVIRSLQILDRKKGDRALPALIMCPNSVKNEWARQLDIWWPGVRYVVAGSGTPAARRAIKEVEEREADILIINFEAVANVSRLAGYGSISLRGCVDCDPMLALAAETWDNADPDERARTRPGAPSRCERSDKELNLIDWATVVADEVHHIEEPNTKQTRAAWYVMHQADHRFGLTGTPSSDPGKFWSLLHAIAPDEFPVKGKYVDRYVLTQPNFFSGFNDTIGYRAETREELNRIVQPRFLRRTWEMVFPDELPPIYMARHAELSGKQKKAYDAFRKELLAEVDGGLIWTSNPLTKLLRLRQLASAYAEATPDGGLILSEPSSKLDVLDEVLEELGPIPVVIFAESKQLIKLAGARLEKAGNRTFGYVTGDEDAEARALAVASFQTGVSNTLLGTVAAGGEGIAMDAADTVIFLQRPWSEKLNEQAEMRIRMPGVGAHTTIIDIMTEGTVDERVALVLSEKSAMLQELVQDEKTLREWLK